jgi:hypothetical protein
MFVIHIVLRTTTCKRGWWIPNIHWSRWSKRSWDWQYFLRFGKNGYTIVKKAASSAGKTLLRSGAKFAGVLLQGKNIKEAAKQRALEAVKSIGRNTLSTVWDFASGNPSSGHS